MSDERRDLATLQARLDEKDQEIRRLKNRLRALANCENHRCFLCSDCLEAAGVWIRGYRASA